MAHPPPWAAAPRHEQMFVLVTGTNSGVGLGTCQRLIDEFLRGRSSAAHLVLLITTRSATKARETAAAIGSFIRAAGGKDRVHVVSVLLDLCDIEGVREVAARIRDETVDLFTGLRAEREMITTVQVRIERIDALVCNAGVGGFVGISWGGFMWQMLTRGLSVAATWPDYKISRVGATVSQKTKTMIDTEVGEVFCANVLGHYVLAHELMALLSREPNDVVPPARIIWTSSTEPVAADFSADDLQGLRTTKPYESSKRLTDLLALTATLPAAARPSASFFEIPHAADDELRTVRPHVCLSHPGIVASSIMPLPFAGLLVMYAWTMYLIRWFGSPWHVVSAYLGATASVWLALEPEGSPELEGVKWGSSCDFFGRPAVKMTEVEGWGWRGVPEEEGEEDIRTEKEKGRLAMAVGRRPGVRTATREDRQAFEALGAQCWAEMERLRGELTGN